MLRAALEIALNIVGSIRCDRDCVSLVCRGGRRVAKGRREMKTSGLFGHSGTGSCACTYAGQFVIDRANPMNEAMNFRRGSFDAHA
jgi:hypothetical protein